MIKFKTPGLYLVIIILMIIFVTDISAYRTAYGDKIATERYEVSRSIVDRIVSQGDVFRDTVEIKNFGEDKLEASFSISEGLVDILEFEEEGVLVEPQNITRANFLIKGVIVANYTGEIIIKGDINEKIIVNVTVLDNSATTPVIMKIELLKKSYNLKGDIDFKLNMNKLKSEEIRNVTLSYFLYSMDTNQSYLLVIETIDVTSSFATLKRYKIPEELLEGDYILQTTLEYESYIVLNESQFVLKRPFLQIMVFGFIPMWLLLIFFGIILGGILTFLFIKKRIEKNKKYQMKLDYKSIPKKNPDYFHLGKIAETNNPAYLEPNRLSTHSIVAGATGGGKSIAAQVIVEEALLHNVAVIVFDPTAQWSGMLRKCDDKKMISFYPKFGLKETDARAFKGNVRQIKNSRELVDVKKYMNPGQIQILSLNKLDPKGMDIFIANVIRQIFRSDPKESPDLKLLLVFDEVHRLLSKFGGSGEGFLQVERSCREFRKWGLGVMLISQVLSDFVGEIKANISTEVQMRTRDENDLNRIKTKNGEEFLKSLVKASIGVGMFVNPTYNHGKPYFINFRPILHNTRRLPDEELEKYNNYNDIVEDIEFQIEQLEKEKIDTFDLKMELKLVKDKIMTGSFSVVEIYLEGLKPRVGKEWEKLGKKPPVRQIQLVDEAEILKSIEEAKKERDKIRKEEADQIKKDNLKKAEENVVVEDLRTKEVSALTFDNGVMLSSIKELLGMLPTMDSEIFKIHVNENKNDIADWFTKNFSKEFGDSIKGVMNKVELTKMIEEFLKPKKVTKEVEKKKEEKEKPKDSKEANKNEEKKEDKKEDQVEGKKGNEEKQKPVESNEANKKEEGVTLESKAQVDNPLNNEKAISGDNKDKK